MISMEWLGPVCWLLSFICYLCKGYCLIVQLGQCCGKRWSSDARCSKKIVGMAGWVRLKILPVFNFYSSWSKIILISLCTVLSTLHHDFLFWLGKMICNYKISMKWLVTADWIFSWYPLCMQRPLSLCPEKAKVIPRDNHMMVDVVNKI